LNGIHGLAVELGTPCEFDEGSAGFFHIGDRSREWDADSPVASQRIEALRIEAYHFGGWIAGEAVKHILVVLIHVLENSDFFGFRKRIRFCEFPGAEPMNLTEAPDESDTHRFEPEEVEGVRTIVLSGGGEVPKITFTRVAIISQWICMRDDCHATARLHVI